LSLEDASQYRIVATDPKGVTIEYKDLDGDVLIAVDGKPYERTRLYAPVGSMKYRTRTGSGTAAYLPQHPDIDWAQVANDPSTPLVITEGEFKALEACRKWGAPTIGLGGVNSWSPGKKDPKANLCRPLDQFIWSTRTVFIAFDYDGQAGGRYKPQVEKAARAFAVKLAGLGSRVFILYPGLTDRAVEGRKMGLDDYIEAGGEWEALEATREEHEGDPALGELLTNYAFYEPTPSATIIRLEDGYVQTLASWRDKKRHLYTAALVSGKPVLKPSTEVWLQSKEKLTVKGYCFRPGEAPGLTGDMHWNIWTGYAVEGRRGAGAGEKLGRWLRFGERLFGEHWGWVQQWVGHMMQRPEEKCTITVTVMSPQEGIGKTLFADFLARIIGPTHARYIGVNQMFEKHTEWPRGTLLGVVNELQSGYERHEDQLKDLVTADRVWINPKGLKEYSVEALFRLYFTTNRSYPFRLSADSRRHFIWRPDLLARDEEWKAFLKGVVGPLVDDEEALEAIRAHLNEVSLEGFNPKDDAPWTEAREDVAEASLSNREAKGSTFYDVLPEVFILTGEMKRNAELRVELDWCMKQEADRAGHSISVAGRVVKVTVHSKREALPTKKVAHKHGVKRMLDTGLFSPERVREAYEATCDALGLSKF
jgi:hypothetical protein